MYKRISDSEAINVVYNSILPLIRGILDGDAAIVINDIKETLYYEPGKDIDFKIPVGTPTKGVPHICNVIES